MEYEHKDLRNDLIVKLKNGTELYRALHESGITGIAIWGPKTITYIRNLSVINSTSICAILLRDWNFYD